MGGCIACSTTKLSIGSLRRKFLSYLWLWFILCKEVCNRVIYQPSLAFTKLPKMGNFWYSWSFFIRESKWTFLKLILEHVKNSCHCHFFANSNFLIIVPKYLSESLVLHLAKNSSGYLWIHEKCKTRFEKGSHPIPRPAHSTQLQWGPFVNYASVLGYLVRKGQFLLIFSTKEGYLVGQK